jgi:multiple sugar transport system permease protein/putative aldouronate transport system permease protein
VGQELMILNHNQQKVFNRAKRHWQLYLLLLLPLVWLIIFQYVPMYGAQIAFKKYIVTKGITGSPWIGLDNFERFLNSAKFELVMMNTIVLSFYQLIGSFPFPIILALCLNQVRQKAFKKTVQLVTYAPHFISMVVLVGIMIQVFHPRIGLTAFFAGMLEVDAPNWMGSRSAFPHVYVGSGLWQNVGFRAIIYLAVLATIDPTLHEAAIVDGANKLQRMWYIDLPGLLPTAVVLLVLQTGRVLNISFEKIYLMQNPINIRVSEVISTYVYKVGLLSPVLDFSYATAIGLLQGVVSLLLIISVNRLAQRLSGHGIW